MSSAQPHPQVAESPKPPARTVTIRRKSLVIAFLIATSGVGVAYLVGWASQRQEVVEVRESRQQVSSELEGRVKELEARVHLLEVRRQLALTLAAIDERNFGIASKHLKMADSLLGRLEKDAKVAKIAKSLAGFRLVATENLAAQRRTILDWANGLDATLEAGK